MPHHPSAPSAPRPRTRSQGFTLVEMAVVLLLVSLLVGGTITAKNMIRSAELKSVHEEVGALRQVVRTFKDRYESYPGDMFNATKFWTAQNAAHGTCIITASTSVATCNGDGNGWITTAGVGTTYYEANRFWQHLSNAGLLPGKYTGEDTLLDAFANCNLVNHCGAAKYKGGLYYAASVFRNFNYFRTPTDALDMFGGDDKGNVVVFFGSQSVASPAGAFVGKPIITTSDALNLDQKLDDGKPMTGFIQSFRPLVSASYLANACTVPDGASFKYDISDDKALCALVFTNAF